MYRFYTILMLPVALSERQNCSSDRNFTEILENPTWNCNSTDNETLHGLVLRWIGLYSNWTFASHNYSVNMTKVACAVSHGLCPPRNLNFWNITYGQVRTSKYSQSNYPGNPEDVYVDAADKLMRNIWNLTHNNYNYWDPEEIPFQFGCVNNTKTNRIACAAQW